MKKNEVVRGEVNTLITMGANYCGVNNACVFFFFFLGVKRRDKSPFVKRIMMKIMVKRKKIIT